MDIKNDKNRSILKKIFTKNTITVYAVLIGYAILSAMVYSGIASRQLSSMMIPISCYIVLAISLNLVVGLLGELSLGHAGFMSAGLFTGCLVSIALADSLPLSIRLLLGMLIGGIAAAIVGLIVGLPALRLKGDYLAIVTLACGEIIKNIITNLKITGGALGLDTGSVYSNTKTLLPYGIIIVLITIIVVMCMKRSRHGRAIMAIRDNRIAAEATGINVTYYKLMVFIVAAFFAGVAGVLYGHSLANVKAAAFDYNMSIEILVMVVLGGMGSINGSIIATVLLLALPEMLREFSDYRMLLYSILLIVIMLLNASPRFKELKGRWSIPNIVSFIKKQRSGAAASENDSAAKEDSGNDK